MFERDEDEFRAGSGGAVGEGFFVADWREAGGDVFGVGEFGGFGGERVGVAAEDGGFPVYLRVWLAWVDVLID